MAAPSTTDEFLALTSKSELIPADKLEAYVRKSQAEAGLPDTTMKVAQALVVEGLLTKYQAEQLLMGRWRNFVVAGKYKLLERLGRGGMAMVFLCEHLVMKRLVALKILPTAHGEDRELLGRFHREARALSQLRHPNIVGAYDVDHANKVHFLVMEYVDGGDLEWIVQRSGPMDYERAAHYIRQAAYGLQHAHECGLVHRDIKPGNLLVDRAGTVKLLDLGLARIFHETHDDLTTGRDAKTLLGTVDYLAPEQAINSHDVDIRVDIYGLGATFYFMLTGKGLFEDGTVAQKLSWHLHRPPVSLLTIRPDIPAELVEVIEKMLAKKADDRYQTPIEVFDALEPWTQNPIDPPKIEELPRLSRAARGAGTPSTIMRQPQTLNRSTAGSSSRGAETRPKSTLIIASDSDKAKGPSSNKLPKTVTSSPILPPEIESEAAPIPRKKTSSSPSKKRSKLIPAAIGLAVVVFGGVLLWAFLAPPGSSDGNTARPPRVGAATGSDGGGVASGDVNRGPKETVISADQAADATYVVIPETGATKSFANLKEAVKGAKSGDRVVIRGSLIREAIELSDVEGVPKDLTIEGVGPQGGPVRWRGPKDLSQGRALLDVSGLEGLKLKGFFFDGQGKVTDLIRLSGLGSGSTLESIQVMDATHAGIVLRGWNGEDGRPVTLKNVQFETDAEAEGAILFEVDPDRPTIANRAVKIDSCRFVGPYQAALSVSGPIDGLEIEHCRFFRATDALRYRRANTRGGLKVKFLGNTFVDLQRGLHFETTPPAATSDIVATNNLFMGTARIASLDKVSVQPNRSTARWIWTDEGKVRANVPVGDRFFRKTFEVSSVPDKATLNIGCDETFEVWINGVEVARSATPYFTQRVFSYEVAGRLRRGRNVIAVKGNNLIDRLDPKFGTAAALIVQLTTTANGRETVLAQSDETWKCSEEASDAWTKPEFDDKSWNAARPWPEGGATWPWIYSIWDSTVLTQIKPPLEPIRIAGAGNLRDYKSWEGYPTVDSERVVVNEKLLSKDPREDAKFLRIPRSHPLAQAGVSGVPVGVFEQD